jgi:hypothetical protein
MTVAGFDGDDVKCVWTDPEGHIASERLPIEALEPGIRILGGFRRPIPNDLPMADADNPAASLPSSAASASEKSPVEIPFR